MIYDAVSTASPLTQGDIISGCPLLYWDMSTDPTGSSLPVQVTSTERVIVLTQSCDLVNARTTRVQVALIQGTQRLVERGILKSQTIRDQVRRHQVFGWYFLPAGNAAEESIFDFRDLHPVPRELLEQLVQQGQRRLTLKTPFREHLAQHFGITYSRIALPEPYPTTDN